MASKKTICDRVRRGVAGKTRDEIMDAICAEFDLPRPKAHTDKPEPVVKPKAAKKPREVK